MKTPIGQIDEILHKERIRLTGNKSTYKEKLGNLPVGSFIVYDGKPYIIRNPNMIINWTPFGYTETLKLPPPTELIVLTPKSIVNTFRSGYIPQIHETALNLLSGQ